MKKYSQLRFFVSQINMNNYGWTIAGLFFLGQLHYWFILLPAETNSIFRIIMPIIVIIASFIFFHKFIGTIKPAWKFLNKEVYLNHVANQELLSMIKIIDAATDASKALEEDRIRCLELIEIIQHTLNILNSLDPDTAKDLLRASHERFKSECLATDSYKLLNNLEDFAKAISTEPEVFKANLILIIMQMAERERKLSECLSQIASIKQNTTNDFNELLDKTDLATLQKANSNNNQV